MSDRAYAKVQTQQKTSMGLSPKSSLLQRTCACGQHTIAGAQCSTCRSEQSTLLRSHRAFRPPSAPGAVPGSSPAQEHGLSFNSAFERASRFDHDFSQIPIHAPAKGVIQTKLAISKPGDEFEQEADRLSEHVMRMPEPQLQRACACDGGCPRCQTGQSDQEHEHLRMKRVGSSDLEQTVVPPMVHEVLRSPGQPLDPATRAFMEPRFGWDFSAVRVHADESAARSARTLNAGAFTVGTDIAFAAGRYTPASTRGRTLLAHELAHVMQQATGPHILARQTDEQYGRQGIKLDPAVLQSWVGAGFWELKIRKDFILGTDPVTDARFKADREEQDAVLSVVWQMKPQTPITADITNFIIVPKRAGASTSKNLVYQIIFKPRKSPSDPDSIHVIFTTESAGATSIVLASSPPTTFTPSLTLPPDPFWPTHPEEKRRILYWIETQAPGPSFDQIITTTVTGSDTTRSTSFSVKGSKNSQGQVTGGSVRFLGDAASSTKTPTAGYASHGSEDPATGDKLGSINGLAALPLSPDEQLLVKEAVRQYFYKGGVRNAEVDAIVPIDSTKPRRVLCTFRFKPNTADPRTNDVDIQWIGEEGKDVSLAPQDTLALSRVNGYSEHIKGTDEDDKVRRLKKWLGTRYRAVTPKGSTIAEVEKNVTAEIRTRSSDWHWYKANYHIDILNKTDAEKELKTKVSEEERQGLKNFTSTELLVLELVLETMSDTIVKTFEGLKLIRQEIINKWVGPGLHDFKPDPETGGITLEGPRIIIIFDAASNEDDAMFLGGIVPGGKPTVEISSAQPYAHELGHTIGFRDKPTKDRDTRSAARKAFDFLVESKSIKPVTKYAERPDRDEFFAESFALYYSDPEWLKQNRLDLYNFFDTLDKTGEPPKPPKPPP